MASKTVVRTGGSVISRLLNNPMLIQKQKINHLIPSSCFEIAPMISPPSLSKLQTITLPFLPQTDEKTLKRISFDGFLYPCGLPSLRFFLPQGDDSSSANQPRVGGGSLLVELQRDGLESQHSNLLF